MVLIARHYGQISKHGISQKKKPKEDNNSYIAGNHPKIRVGKHHPNRISQKALIRSTSIINKIHIINN